MVLWNVLKLLAAATAAVVASAVIAATSVVVEKAVATATACKEKDNYDNPPAAVVVSEHEISPREINFDTGAAELALF